MSKTLKIVATWSHSDGVSGTSLFSDGTRAYWTEGRSSSVVYISNDGQTASEEVSNFEGSDHLDLLNGDEYGLQRQMTPFEEMEHDYVRGNGAWSDKKWRTR